MIEKDTGGPAFPCDSKRYESEGMTMRDYFAAKVMPAIYKDFWDDVRCDRYSSVTEDWQMGLAIDAYSMADAMLEARKK